MTDSTLKRKTKRMSKPVYKIIDSNAQFESLAADAGLETEAQSFHSIGQAVDFVRDLCTMDDDKCDCDNEIRVERACLVRGQIFRYAFFLNGRKAPFLIIERMDD